MRPASRLVVAFLVGVAGTWLVSSLADSATPGGSMTTASPPVTTTATTAPSTGTREHPPGPVEPTSTSAPSRSRTVALPGIGAPRVARSASDVRGTTSRTATGRVSSTVPTAVDVTFPEPWPSTTQADDADDDDAGDGGLGEPPVDHDEHDHEQLDDAGLADAFAVALWSWRFDDTDGRLERTVGAYAETSVLAPLMPAPDELQRRRELREVSWAIVVAHEVTGDEHRVELTQHAYNDASAETTTTRHVVVAVTAGRVTAATIVDQPTP